MVKFTLKESHLKIFIFLILAICISTSIAFADTHPDQIITYKTINNTELKLHIFNPPQHKASDSKPAIVLFFGGGWNSGKPKQFYDQSQYFSSRGMVAIAAEYRIKNTHKTSPKEAVKDSKSAMRWVRSHADELGINPNMLAAGGGSAGGHLAISAAVIKNFNEENEDISVSSRPDALVLFNPVFDNGPNGYGYERVKDYWQAFSPLHNLDENVPPTIVFMGTKDRFVPVETTQLFKRKMEENGRRCELFLYPDQPHGFFNKSKKNNKYKETLLEADNFLTSLGYLQSEASL